MHKLCVLYVHIWGVNTFQNVFIDKKKVRRGNFILNYDFCAKFSGEPNNRIPRITQQIMHPMVFFSSGVAGMSDAQVFYFRWEFWFNPFCFSQSITIIGDQLDSIQTSVLPIGEGSDVEDIFVCRDDAY